MRPVTQPDLGKMGGKLGAAGATQKKRVSKCSAAGAAGLTSTQMIHQKGRSLDICGTQSKMSPVEMNLVQFNLLELSLSSCVQFM